jgi:hypothetical protein
MNNPLVTKYVLSLWLPGGAFDFNPARQAVQQGTIEVTGEAQECTEHCRTTRGAPSHSRDLLGELGEHRLVVWPQGAGAPGGRLFSLRFLVAMKEGLRGLLNS